MYAARYTRNGSGSKYKKVRRDVVMQFSLFAALVISTTILGLSVFGISPMPETVDFAMIVVSGICFLLQQAFILGYVCPQESEKEVPICATQRNTETSNDQR